MMRGALSDITKAVGHTPIVKLNRVTDGIESDIYVKCEYLNPGGSHKDRVALNMIKDAEAAASSPAARSSRRRAATPAPPSRWSPRSRATSASS